MPPLRHAIIWCHHLPLSPLFCHYFDASSIILIGFTPMPLLHAIIAATLYDVSFRLLMMNSHWLPRLPLFLRCWYFLFATLRRDATPLPSSLCLMMSIFLARFIGWCLLMLTADALGADCPPPLISICLHADFLSMLPYYAISPFDTDVTLAMPHYGHWLLNAWSLTCWGWCCHAAD